MYNLNSALFTFLQFFLVLRFLYVNLYVHIYTHTLTHSLPSAVTTIPLIDDDLFYLNEVRFPEPDIFFIMSFVWTESNHLWQIAVLQAAERGIAFHQSIQTLSSI